MGYSIEASDATYAFEKTTSGKKGFTIWERLSPRAGIIGFMSARQMKPLPSAPPHSPRYGNATERPTAIATEIRISIHELVSTINLTAMSKRPTG